MPKLVAILKRFEEQHEVRAFEKGVELNSLDVVGSKTLMTTNLLSAINWHSAAALHVVLSRMAADEQELRRPTGHWLP
jgi:hypothetical protein